MDKRIRKILADLDQQIKEVKGQGQVIDALIGHGQKAVLLGSQKRWAASAREYGLAAQLAAQASDVATEALARYGQGMALFNLPDRRRETIQVFIQSLELAEQIGHYTLIAKIHFILASFRLDAGDFPGFMTQMSQAIEQLDEEAEAELAARLYQTKASVHLLLAELDQAQANLERAAIAAQRTGNRDIILAVQLDQQVLRGFSITEGTTNTPDLFDALLAQAEQTGNKQIMGDAKIHKTIALLRSGQFQKALKLAQEVRQAALASTDYLCYMRYLIACLLMADAQEHLDDRVGVLATLLTCKKSLEGALGKDIGKLITPFLDALHYRWGAEPLQDVLRQYQSHMAQQGLDTT